MKKGITVIVCCYNSAKRLPDTLKHLSQQELRSEINVEIIVVDNASTDNTSQVAISEWSKYNSNYELKVVREDKSGLINARIKGVCNANFSYIIFCDDDNGLDKKYLDVAFEILESKSDIGAIGGMGVGVSDIEFPYWFKKIEGTYAVGRQQNYDGYLTDRLHLWGAGLASRKGILSKALNPKFPLLLSGRKGKELFGGDDSEICARIQLLGYKLYYTEQLKYRHFITPNRLTEDYRIRMFQGFENSGEVLSKYFEFIIEGRKHIFERLLISISLFFKALIVFVFFKRNKSYLVRNFDKIAVILRLSIFTSSDITKSIIKFIHQRP